MESGGWRGLSKAIQSDSPHPVTLCFPASWGSLAGSLTPHRGKKQCLFLCCVGAVGSTGEVPTGRCSSRNIESSSKVPQSPQSPVSEGQGYSLSLEPQQAMRTTWEVLTESQNVRPARARGVNPVSEHRGIRDSVLLWVLSPTAWVQVPVPFYYLYNLGQGAPPLWAPGILFVNGDNDSTHLTGLLRGLNV